MSRPNPNRIELVVPEDIELLVLQFGDAPLEVKQRVGDRADGVLGGAESVAEGVDRLTLQLERIAQRNELLLLKSELLLERAKRLEQDVRVRLARFGHGDSSSSVVGASEGRAPAGSASADSAGCSCGPQPADADDVIAGRATYADTPGGHADRRTLRSERGES